MWFHNECAGRKRRCTRKNHIATDHVPREDTVEYPDALAAELDQGNPMLIRRCSAATEMAHQLGTAKIGSAAR